MRISNRELRLSVQFTAMGAVWLAWVAAIAFVTSKAEQNARLGMRFADERLIYLLVWCCLPLVLSVAGLVFVYRIRPAPDWPGVHRFLYWVVATLSSLAAVITITGCCVPIQVVRE